LLLVIGLPPIGSGLAYAAHGQRQEAGHAAQNSLLCATSLLRTEPILAAQNGDSVSVLPDFHLSLRVMLSVDVSLRPSSEGPL
jgi:hypothetical protein